ncbi:MAG: alpha/beta hydrolase [Verrucomicrobiales bacterium]
MQKFYPGCIIAVVVSLGSAHADEPGKVVKDIEFAVVGGHSLKLDLYQPPNPEGSGLLVWIHGGGWRKGTREKCFLKWLPKHGYTVASISYRLSDVAKFPAQLHDCKAAVRWLRANAPKYGYRTGKIAVAGASAGGHLSALMATTADNPELEGKVGGNLEQSSRIQAAVDYYGATDFILRSKTQPSRANEKGSVVFDLLGGGADEKTALAKQASAVYHVSRDDAPLLIFHGNKDTTVLLDQSQAIVKAYQKSGSRVQIYVIGGAGHGGNLFYEGVNAQRLLTFLGTSLKAAE